MTDEKPNTAVIATAFAILVSLMLLALAIPRDAFVLVVARPGVSPSAMIDLIGSAGGSFVSGGRYGWLAVAYSDAPDFPSRLLHEGALLVLDHALAAGCIERN